MWLTAPFTDRRGAFSALKSAVFLLLWLPGLWTAWRFATGALEPRPLEEAIHETGLWAVRLLILSLAVTPLRRVLDWPRLVTLRRMVGVACFAYALVHLLLYVADQNFDLGRVANEILLRIYLTIGFVALLGLALLAATSTDAMMRRLGGRRWQRLHRLVYLLAPLGIVHFFLQAKLQSNEAVVLGGLFVWLMAYRLLYAKGLATPLALALLAVAVGLATAFGEAAVYALASGIDPERLLNANLRFRFGPRPGWIVLGIGLVTALAALLRHGRRKQRPSPAGRLSPSA